MGDIMKKIIYLTPRYDYKKIHLSIDFYNNFSSKKYLLLPLPFILDENDLTNLLKKSAGVIMIGGIDLNPNLYQQKNINSDYIDVLDNYDFLILKICLKHNIKVLGICRGLQVLNVFFQGSLNQNIDNHQNTRHQVTIIKDFLIYKRGTLSVNSFHHQAIERLGKDLDVLAYSHDNVIEAITYKNLFLALQWHPEKDESFTNLVETFFN